MDRQLENLLDGKLWDFYGYSPAAPLVLTPNAQGTSTLSVQANSAFLALAATLTVVDNSDPATVIDPAPLTVRVSTSAGTDFFSAPQHVRNVFGVGELPCWWPFYRLCEPTTVISMEFASLEGTDTIRVFPTLLGIRLYNQGWGT